MKKKSNDDIRELANQRAIKKEGTEFLSDPGVQGSGIASEIVADEMVSIKAERKRQKNRSKRGTRVRRSRPVRS